MKMDMLKIKLASIAVHAEELLDESPEVEYVTASARFDVAAIRTLLSDPIVRAYLDDRGNAVLLPRKRSARG